MTDMLKKARRQVARLSGRLEGFILATGSPPPGFNQAAQGREATQEPVAEVLCERADRYTRRARAAGKKVTPELEAVVLEAESALSSTSPSGQGAAQMKVLRNQLLHARLRVSLMRRHAARVFHLADETEWESEWDSEALSMLLDAHAMVGTPYAQLRKLFQRISDGVGEDRAEQSRDDYLDQIGDWLTRVRRAFAIASADATNPDRRRALRELVATIAEKPLDVESREELMRFAEQRVTGRPARAATADAVVLAFGVAITLDQRLRALALYEVVRHQEPNDRGMHSLFQRFYVRLIYFLHTRAKTDAVTQPLEQEPWWIAYANEYRGMSSLTSSGYWRTIMEEETVRRALFEPARSSRDPNGIVFVSNTPKFSYPLMDLMNQAGLGVHAVHFDFIEEVYRRNRMIDLMARPLEACASVGIRKQIFAHPLVKRVAEAECIFVDFANRAAVWASWFKRPGQRLIIRLHAYEALSAWPYLINWAAVDGLVFVSPAIEAIFRRELGERLTHVPSVVIPNFKVLPDPGPAKPLGRTLGMLGAVIYRKQPVQAVQILKALQKRDSPEWSLRLAGDYWPPETQSPETEHKEEFDRLVAALPNPESVIVDGFQDDVGAWFSRIDFLLSCSLREGTHEAVNEAMHFNTIPIVRDWPLMAESGGARCVYPVLEEHGLLYTEVDQAVEGILAARETHAETVRAMSNFVRTYLNNDRNLKTMLEFIGNV